MEQKILKEAKKKKESEGSGAGLQRQQLQATNDWRRKEIKVDTVAAGMMQSLGDEGTQNS